MTPRPKGWNCDWSI